MGVAIGIVMAELFRLFRIRGLTPVDLEFILNACGAGCNN